MARTLKTSAYLAKTGTYTARKEDEVVLANGTFTINLYAASEHPGHTLLIKNIGAGSITVTGNGAELIEGNNSMLLTSLQSASVFNDGTEWWKTTTADRSATGEFTNDGNSGASKTIDWGEGNGHLLTLTANCTLTLSNPTDGGRYLLLVDSGAGNFLITWPAHTKWGGGGVPLNTQVASKRDVFTMVYAATANQFYMSYALGY